MTLPPAKIPTNAQRALELAALGLPGSRIIYRARQLNFWFEITPGSFGRTYRCLLTVMPDGRTPVLLVMSPDLQALAGKKKIPHTYSHVGSGTKLCLWFPKSQDWIPQMKFGDTYIPWAAEWLYYFEVWLATGEWEGGGAHPDAAPKRWSVNSRTCTASVETSELCSI